MLLASWVTILSNVPRNASTLFFVVRLVNGHWASWARSGRVMAAATTVCRRIGILGL